MITFEQIKKLEEQVGREFIDVNKLGDWINDVNGEARTGRLDWMGYYPFLYLLCKETRPQKVIELGTCHGTSAVFLKQGYQAAEVITIDIVNRDPELLKKYGINFLLSDSVEAAQRIEGPIDILFIDTEHTNERARAETEVYMPKMRKEGLIAYDDIDIIKTYWNTITLPKIEVNSLHWTGFGIVQT